MHSCPKKAHFKLELGNIPSKNISSPESITFLKKSFTFYNLNSESMMLVISFHSVVRVYLLMPLKGTFFTNCSIIQLANAISSKQFAYITTMLQNHIYGPMLHGGKMHPLKCFSVIVCLCSKKSVPLED